MAVRAKEISVTDAEGEYNFSFSKCNYSIEEYKMFMRKTKLFDLLENHIVSNLVDYATGVETGLDSNGRKNRGGHLMENLVESYIQKAGFVKDKNYFQEMYIHEIEQKWGVNLSAISNQVKMEKRFDFVIKTDKQIYVIEDKNFDIKLKPIFQTIVENQYNLEQKNANNRTSETGIKKGLETNFCPNNRKNSPKSSVMQLL